MLAEGMRPYEGDLRCRRGMEGVERGVQGGGAMGTGW
jgi:hypothetical protein